MAAITSSFARADPLENPQILTRLRRANSATSSTTSLRTTTTLPAYSSTVSLSPNTYPSDRKEDLFTSPSDDDASAIFDLSIHTKPFKADKTFQINSMGKKLVSLPLSSTELEIEIDEMDVEGYVDGISERYRSIRPERKKDSEWTKPPASETTYRFGPGKPPTVKLLGLGTHNRGEVIDEFELKGVSAFNRSVAFESKRFGRLQWRYAGKKEKKAWKCGAGSESSIKSNPDNLLILEKIVRDTDWKGNCREVVEVARMVRNAECRTVGTKRHDEGNGGRVEVDFVALMIGAVGSTTELVEWGGEDGKREIEAMVLATALVMMKKEIDRLRAIQIAVLSGMAG